MDRLKVQISELYAQETTHKSIWGDLLWGSLFKPKALKQSIGLECGALGRQTTLPEFTLKCCCMNIVFSSLLAYPLVPQSLRCRNTLENWRRVSTG